MTTVTKETFRDTIAGLTAQIAGRALDGALDAWLNAEHGPGSAAAPAGWCAHPAVPTDPP